RTIKIPGKVKAVMGPVEATAALEVREAAALAAAMARGKTRVGKTLGRIRTIKIPGKAKVTQEVQEAAAPVAVTGLVKISKAEEVQIKKTATNLEGVTNPQVKGQNFVAA
ncbi:hypothetical protein, partial [Bacillus sp. MUM 116]|uniref:hypothetical protein n=1 Tax=Bacillus sp. MUM 116 TaxID=1678002 RepID=UPI0015A5970C